MDIRRISIRSDEGRVQTAALGALVGVMIAAAAVALLLVAFNGDSSSKGHGNQANQAAAAQVTDTPAATTPSSSAAPSSTAAPSSSAPTSSAAPKTTAAPTKPTATPKPSTSTPRSSSGTAPTKAITYTVKRGDNLSVIAAWFHQHGYGKLYELNKKIIGDNPDLIFPGQKITISGRGMSVSS